jgi:reverse gyrase
MTACLQCGGEVTDGWVRLGMLHCNPCMVKAMDELTTADIAQAMERLAEPTVSLDDLKAELKIAKE